MRITKATIQRLTSQTSALLIHKEPGFTNHALRPRPIIQTIPFKQNCSLATPSDRVIKVPRKTTLTLVLSTIVLTLVYLLHNGVALARVQVEELFALSAFITSSGRVDCEGQTIRDGLRGDTSFVGIENWTFWWTG
jgi:hypothetical protein